MTQETVNTLMSLLSVHVLFMNHYVLAGATRPAAEEMFTM